jgi:hypothetical protein
MQRGVNPEEVEFILCDGTNGLPSVLKAGGIQAQLDAVLLRL